MALNPEIVLQYFPEFTQAQRQQIEQLGVLYPRWNEAINVISRKDIDNLYPHHVLHSLAIAKYLQQVPEGATLLDMGTGGGFPGIPLAIAYPQAHFHLIDRVGKKIRVAREIAAELGLENVSFQHGDIGECHDKFTMVVSRAVMTLDSLVPLVRKNINHSKDAIQCGVPNGLICLKGGDLRQELKATKKIASEPLVEDLSTYFPNLPFFETKKLIYLPL